MSTQHPRIEPSLEPDALALPRRRPGRPEPPPARRSWLGRVFLLLLILFLLPPAYVLALRWLPPPTTSFMLQSDAAVDYRWVPAARISEAARKAVIAAEDQKFWTHNGFDIEAIEKAYLHNQKSRRRRGASTITQQVAKNLFLWPGGGYFRKGVEATFTVLIEALWDKPRILEVYLNIAEFGSGVYGVEAAAQRNFGKPAAALSAQEAAQLAAVLPSPRRYKVRAAGPYVQARTRWILRQMGYGRSAQNVVETEPEPEPELPPENADDAMPLLESWPEAGEQAPAVAPEAGEVPAEDESTPAQPEPENVPEPPPAEPAESTPETAPEPAVSH